MRRRTVLVGGVAAVVALAGAGVASQVMGGGADRSPDGVPPRGDRAVGVVAVGDIACEPEREITTDECRHEATSDLALSLQPDAVLALGDLQYDDGQAEGFAESYDPSWGRLRAVTHPVPGNHEYHSQEAQPYFDYFGAAAGEAGQGWYGIDLGAWHVVALNSNCDDVGCDPESEQVRWLRSDLAAHPSQCLLAFWHHPRWSYGKHGNDDTVQPFLDVLDEAGVDVVLTGHDHAYERFEPRTADGEADPDGLRAFVVGTGGRSHYEVEDGDGLQASVEDRFGVLDLALWPGGYDWRFVAEVDGAPGADLDSGSADCR